MAQKNLTKSTMRLWFPISMIRLPNTLQIHLEGDCNSERAIQQLLLVNPILTESKVFHAVAYFSHGFSSAKWGCVWRNPGMEKPESRAWKVVAMYDHVGTPVTTARRRTTFYSHIVKGPVHVFVKSHNSDETVTLRGISRTGSPPPLIPIPKRGYIYS